MTGEKSDVKLLWKLIFWVAAIWAGSGLIVYWLIPDWPSGGQFGDLYGAVNSLFSGLAIAGVIYAIFLQRIQLNMQSKVLNEQNALISGQLIAMQKSNRSQILFALIEYLQRPDARDARGVLLSLEKVAHSQ